MISGPTFGMKWIDDGERARQRVRSGTARRVLPYFTRYRWTLVFLFFVTAGDSAITVANPVLLGGQLQVHRGQALVTILFCRREPACP